MTDKYRMTNTVCLNCSVIFRVRAYELTRGNGKYCSRNCRNIIAGAASHAGGRKTGINNPNYRGGISKNAYNYKLKSIAKYPEKHSARLLVAKAIKDGVLIKKSCEKCGEIYDVHAHHQDYSKPLEVIWLCGKHHNEEHQ